MCCAHLGCSMALDRSQSILQCQIARTLLPSPTREAPVPKPTAWGMRFERDVMEVREDESCCSARRKKAEARTRRFGFAPHVNRERKSGAKRRQNPSVAGRSIAGGACLDQSIFAVSKRSHQRCAMNGEGPSPKRMAPCVTPTPQTSAGCEQQTA